MNNDVIMVTEKDFLRIKNILETQNSEELENLELELERAKVISEDEVPPDLITMNTRLTFLLDQKEMTVTVVYPSEANSQEGKISVLASLGSALIGLRTGQEINWKFPDGKTTHIKILKILEQPEPAGDNIRQ
jgi:regulator of nucleoside diphosphate kinase